MSSKGTRTWSEVTKLQLGKKSDPLSVQPAHRDQQYLYMARVGIVRQVEDNGAVNRTIDERESVLRNIVNDAGGRVVSIYWIYKKTLFERETEKVVVLLFEAESEFSPNQELGVGSITVTMPAHTAMRVREALNGTEAFLVIDLERLYRSQDIVSD